MRRLHDVEVPDGMVTATGTEDHPPEARYYFVRDWNGRAIMRAIVGLLAVVALAALWGAWETRGTRLATEQIVMRAAEEKR
jgi:hypothetical protein